jgi:PAS domain S-box-containing protein
MEDQRLFTVFASQASLALRNSRLYGQLRSRVQELSTLSSLTEVISSTLDLDFILNQVADNLVGVVGYDRCLLYLRESLGDGRADKFVPKITRGVDVSILTSGEDGAPPDDTQELIATIAHMMVPVLVEEQDYSLPMARKYCRAMGLLSFHAQPISVRGRAIGVLVVTTDITRRPLALSNLDLLATFIQHAGIAIENARLYAQMERQVRELNALYNMTKTLTTTYGVSRACSTVNKVAAELTRSDACLLLLFNDRLDTLRVRSMFGLPADLSEYVRLLPDTAQVGREARFLREPLAVSLYRHPEQESLFGVQWAPMLSALQSRYSHLLLVPLVTDEANVGYLVLGTNSGSGYHVDESKLVSILASNAAAVLRNAAIYEQSMEQRVLELSALYEVSKQVRSARSFTSALDSILDIVASIVLCDEAIIYTVDNETGHLHVRAARGEESEKQIGADVPTAGSGIAAWVVLEQKALLSADITSDERFAPTSGSTQMRSLMAIPVFLADEALAVLIVQSAIPNLYSEDNVKMISLIAAQAAALFREMESVRELTSYTENVLRSIAAGVVTLDPAGRIVTFNSAAERILRLSGSDVLGQRLDQIVGLLHADEKDCADTLKMVTLAVEARQTVHRHRLRYHVVSERDDEATLDQENESVVVNASASILSNERDEYLGVVLVFEDITKEEEMEQELTRMGRLAEIGQLAAGIAHELRNPLASIKGAAQVVLSELPADIVDRHREFLDIIVSEVNALKDVTSEFLEFSRPTPPDMTLLDLNSLLSRRLAFLGPEFERGDIAVRQIYDPALPQIEADAGQIDRVVTNLVLNAVQAMPEGGIFTVATICAPGGRNDIVEVCLSDTGIGMTEETLGRLFTPFYTTKTKGTGLGLAIAQKIVDAHGGRIHVRSTPGAGAAFTLILPVVSPMSGPFVLESDDSADISAQRLHTPYKHRQPPDDVDYNKDGIGWENPVTSL